MLAVLDIHVGCSVGKQLVALGAGVLATVEEGGHTKQVLMLSSVQGRLQLRMSDTSLCESDVLL